MGVIYKKTCSETGQVYFGKFEGYWSERCKTGWVGTTCEHFVNPTVEFLELDVPNDKLKEKEIWYIQNLECVNIMEKYSNLSIPQYSKQYYDKNKDTILAKAKTDNYKNAKKYRNKNKDKIASKQKEFYINNKEIVMAIHKKSYIKNKDKINEPTPCNICGSIISKQNLSKHKRTKKCMNFIKN